MLHDLTNSEEYLYKITDKGNYGLLGEEAIELVKNATSLLQFISFEKCKQANLSVEWEMFCLDRGIEFMPFQKAYAVRTKILNTKFNILNRSPTSQISHQHLKSVTNIFN